MIKKKENIRCSLRKEKLYDEMMSKRQNLKIVLKKDELLDFMLNYNDDIQVNEESELIKQQRDMYAMIHQNETSGHEEYINFLFQNIKETDMNQTKFCLLNIGLFFDEYLNFKQKKLFDHILEDEEKSDLLINLLYNNVNDKKLVVNKK